MKQRMNSKGGASDTANIDTVEKKTSHRDMNSVAGGTNQQL